jgi:hypothetical protein
MVKMSGAYSLFSNAIFGPLNLSSAQFEPAELLIAASRHRLLARRAFAFVALPAPPVRSLAERFLIALGANEH